jgi:hypothetical protein
VRKYEHYLRDGGRRGCAELMTHNSKQCAASAGHLLQLSVSMIGPSRACSVQSAYRNQQLNSRFDLSADALPIQPSVTI